MLKYFQVNSISKLHLSKGDKIMSKATALKKSISGILFSSAMFASNPTSSTTLPEYEVTPNEFDCIGPCYDRPRIEDGGGYYSGGGGGGGGGGASIIRDAFNNPNNPVPATCRSSPETRQAHAHEDGKPMLLRAFVTFSRLPHVGEIFRVEYDDGGTELYQWTGMSDPLDNPVPGSLTCP
jgi:hypothetical protein